MVIMAALSDNPYTVAVIAYTENTQDLSGTLPMPFAGRWPYLSCLISPEAILLTAMS